MYLSHLKILKSQVLLGWDNFSAELIMISSVLRSTGQVCQRRQWQPTPVLLPRKSYGQRSLVGCNPWGREESDTTERLHFSHSCIGEGNGNPVQCSCLENPRDGGAWWAAVYGVAPESDTTEATQQQQQQGLVKCFYVHLSSWSVWFSPVFC